MVRDLHKKDDSLEQQSYSERQIYLTALNRLSNEYAAVQNLEKKSCKKQIRRTSKSVNCFDFGWNFHRFILDSVKISKFFKRVFFAN